MDSNHGETAKVRSKILLIIGSVLIAYLTYFKSSSNTIKHIHKSRSRLFKLNRKHLNQTFSIENILTETSHEISKSISVEKVQENHYPAPVSSTFYTKPSTLESTATSTTTAKPAVTKIPEHMTENTADDRTNRSRRSGG